MEASLKASQEKTEQSSVHKMKNSIKGVFQQFRIIRRALIHPDVPWHAKAVAGCAVLYICSPIQIIPNFIPLIGQMDDVLVVTLGIKYLRRCVPQSVLDECESKSHKLRKSKITLNSITDPLPRSQAITPSTY